MPRRAPRGNEDEAEARRGPKQGILCQLAKAPEVERHHGPALPPGGSEQEGIAEGSQVGALSDRDDIVTTRSKETGDRGGEMLVEKKSHLDL